jgi:hypothetical protein
LRSKVSSDSKQSKNDTHELELYKEVPPLEKIEFSSCAVLIFTEVHEHNIERSKLGDGGVKEKHN